MFYDIVAGLDLNQGCRCDLEFCSENIEEVSSEFFAKLTSIKEPTKVVELQSEYAKSAYETFVTESKETF